MANLQTPKSFDADLFAKTTDSVARLCLFLVGECGSTEALWRGKLTAEQQKALFGKKLFAVHAKIQICGHGLTVHQTAARCFGLDSEVVKSFKWTEL